MDLSVPAEVGRAAFVESVEAFMGAVDGMEELELFEASRCRGWTRLDVVVHVLAGWQEVLGGLVSRTDARPTVDAASYWTSFAAAAEQEDPVAELMAQRRRTAAFARPSSALAQLRDVAAAVQRGAGAGVGDGNHVFQGEVLAVGDFLATWAVEHVIHHLDLQCEGGVPSSALTLARSTIEALTDQVLPVEDDVEVVLVGAGRRPVPTGWGDVAGRLPVLG